MVQDGATSLLIWILGIDAREGAVPRHVRKHHSSHAAEANDANFIDRQFVLLSATADTWWPN
jgi:hypothetical protein